MSFEAHHITYIDNLFFLWEGDEKEAKDFVDHLNRNLWGISFTLNYGDNALEFLDPMISHNEYHYTTCTYFKKVDINSYLEYNSGNFYKLKRDKPYGQFVG